MEETAKPKAATHRESWPDKKTYKQPDLRDFGKLHLVTQGTGPSNGDGGQGMMP